MGRGDTGGFGEGPRHQSLNLGGGKVRPFTTHCNSNAKSPAVILSSRLHQLRQRHTCMARRKSLAVTNPQTTFINRSCIFGIVSATQVHMPGQSPQLRRTMLPAKLSRAFSVSTGILPAASNSVTGCCCLSCFAGAAPFIAEEPRSTDLAFGEVLGTLGTWRRNSRTTSCCRWML